MLKVHFSVFFIAEKVGIYIFKVDSFAQRKLEYV